MLLSHKNDAIIYTMYDFTNYQIADIPIFMWSMVGITAALIGYVTVTSNPSVAAAMPTIPGTTSGPSAGASTTGTGTQMGGGKSRRHKKSGSHKSKRR